MDCLSASSMLLDIFSSSTNAFILYVMLSSSFLASTVSLTRSSSALNLSASSTIRVMSSLERRPLSFVIVILFFKPDALSSAETFRMPLASMSNDTLICGTPRGAGAMPDSSNLPSRLLSRVRARSPSNTWIKTPG